MLIRNYFKIIFVALAPALVIQSVAAQAVIFSSDQWPKRWGRVMQSQSINGFINVSHRGSSRFQKTTDRTRHARRATWGKQTDQVRSTYSRTPEYNYRAYSTRQQPTYPVYPQFYQKLYSGGSPVIGQYGVAFSPSLLVDPPYPNYITPSLGYTWYTPNLIRTSYPSIGYPSTAFPLMGMPW